MPNKKDRAWERAKPIRGRKAETWRRDNAGNKIRYGSYGTLGEYGWEVDHKKPVAKGGTEDDRNLQALHWQENREKSDKY